MSSGKILANTQQLLYLEKRSLNCGQFLIKNFYTSFQFRMFKDVTINLTLSIWIGKDMEQVNFDIQCV